MMLLAVLGVVLVSWRGRGVDIVPLVFTRESGYDLSSLLSQADETLHGAKDHGRNRVQTLRKLYLNLTDS